MIDKVFKNKSGGYLKIVSATALDYRAQYLDDDSVQFSLTKDELDRYWKDAEFPIRSEQMSEPVENGNVLIITD